MKILESHMIDLESYSRREHFKHFTAMVNPFLGVTVNVDVTDLVSFCKKNKYSFYITFMHAVALAADEVPEMRQRIHDDGIIEYSHGDTSHIESMGNGTYCYCTLQHYMPFNEYIEYSKKARIIARSCQGINEDQNVESEYFITSLPWLHYSQFSQPFGNPKDSNPCFSWGKFESDFRGRLMMPVTTFVNHALVDGIHIATFYENLNNQIIKILKENS